MLSNNTNITVSDLIKQLQQLDPNLPVIGNVILKDGNNFIYGKGDVYVDFDLENPEFVVMCTSGKVTCS